MQYPEQNGSESDKVAEQELGSWGKIYESVFERSMVGSGAIVFAVWSYCIAKCRPPSGTVELNPMLLGAVFGEKPQDVEEAIKNLCSPDPLTHTAGFDGKRLQHMGAFTYRMVNWKLYRGPKSPEELREYYRKKQCEYRARKKGIDKGTGRLTKNIRI